MANLTKLTENFKFMYERFLTGCDALEDENLWDKEQYGEMEVFFANDIVSIIISLIASDGEIETKEAEYLNKTFGFNYTVRELSEVYKNLQTEIELSDENIVSGVKILKDINPKLAGHYKDMLLLALEILSQSDGETEIKETEKINRLSLLLKS